MRAARARSGSARVVPRDWYYTRRLDMHDELRPGVDQPRRSQYVLVVLIVILLAIGGFVYRRSSEPLPGPGVDARMNIIDRISDGDQSGTWLASYAAQVRHRSIATRRV